MPLFADHVAELVRRYYAVRHQIRRESAAPMFISYYTMRFTETLLADSLLICYPLFLLTYLPRNHTIITSRIRRISPALNLSGNTAKVSTNRSKRGTERQRESVCVVLDIWPAAG